MSTSNGFARLVADIGRYHDHGSLVREYARGAAEEAVDFSAEIREGGRRTQMAVKSLVQGLGNMSKRFEADARAMETRRRAEGRARLAELVADANASVAAGLIGAEDASRLDVLIPRLAARIGAI